MEDERQLVRDLAKRPYSKQALNDLFDAFEELSGRDKRALVAEALSNLNIAPEDLAKLAGRIEQAYEPMAMAFESIARIDQKQVIYHHALLLASQLARKKKAAIFDAALEEEAKKLNVVPAISSKFAETVGPALKKRGFKKAGRDKIQNSVRRLRANRRKSTGS